LVQIGSGVSQGAISWIEYRHKARPARLASGFGAPDGIIFYLVTRSGAFWSDILLSIINLWNNVPRMSNMYPLPQAAWPILSPGSVWLAGAGPGDPGLLTLHALNALRQADVIVYDALVAPEILAWAPQAVLEYAGKRGGKPSAQQQDITLRLLDLARQGKRVLRLKGGDPFVFGRGGEEAQVLIAAGIAVRIIPGITAGIGGLAYAGIPVTHRAVTQAVTFVTGHDATGQTPGLDWQAIAQGSQMIVVYMGMKHVGHIAAQLIAAGRSPDEPAAVVVAATTPDQQVLDTTLARMEADIAAAGLEPPAILCIGEGVRLRETLDWQTLAVSLSPALRPAMAAR
jgi:uroporphyrin-III C-methyltransferase